MSSASISHSAPDTTSSLSSNGLPSAPDDGKKVSIIAPGFGVGPALLLNSHAAEDFPRRIKARQVDSEIEKFKQASIRVIKYLEGIRDLPENAGKKDEIELLDTQITLVEDKGTKFTNHVEYLIKSDRSSAAFAVVTAVNFICGLTHGVSLDMTRLHKDWEAVKDLLLQSLSGEISHSIRSLDSPCIVVHPNPSIAEIQTADRENILGWVVGSQTAASHVRILLRDSPVPVVALEDLSSIKNADVIAINALQERLIINPSDETLADLATLRDSITSGNSESPLNRVAPVTACGQSIKILGTLNTENGIKALKNSGAQNIGLVRSETLMFLGKKRDQWPDEDQQTKILIDLATKFSPGTITIRTVDLGGDKWDPSCGEIPGGTDSKLGLKSTRWALSNPEFFASHLSAIIRAQAEVKNIYPMFPMISDLGEFRQAKDLMEAQVVRLIENGTISKRPPLKIGAMIETPAAALEIRKILKEADFASIGLSDLTQLTLAADRDVAAVNHSFLPYHPANLKLMKDVVVAAKELNKPVSVCGELVSHRTYLPIFLGLGLRFLTPPSDAIAKLNAKLHELYVAECEDLVASMIQADTPAEASAFLSRFHQMKAH